MNLANFKHRTINILNSIDSYYFHAAVNEISEVKLEDNSGFSDFEAKVKVIHIALYRLFENNYIAGIKNPKTQLMISILVDDLEEITLDSILAENADIEAILDFIRSDYIEHIKETFTSTTNFLHMADKLREFYALNLEKSKYKLIPTDEGHKVFTKMKVDVEPESDESVSVNKKTSIGTTGLAACIAACTFAKTDTNKTYLNVCHSSSLTPELIQSIKTAMLKKLKVNPDSFETYLVGGCIGTLKNDIQLLMNTNIGITDLRLLCSDTSLNEGASVAIHGTSDKISYCYAEPELTSELIIQKPVMAEILPESLLQPMEISISSIQQQTSYQSQPTAQPTYHLAPTFFSSRYANSNNPTFFEWLKETHPEDYDYKETLKY